MWEAIARFVLKNKLVLLIALFLVTAFMGWHASKVQLSYEFSRAIPTDNAKYISYQQFRKQFGEDGNLMVIGFQSAHSRQWFRPIADALLIDGFAPVRGIDAFSAILARARQAEDAHYLSPA